MRYPLFVMLALLSAAAPASASTGISCYVEAEIRQVHPQPGGHALQVAVLQSRDNRQVRNDADCRRLFVRGQTLWMVVSLYDDVLDSRGVGGMAAGQRFWLRYGYTDGLNSKGGVSANVNYSPVPNDAVPEW
ncbi:MAG: hypothetical protein Q4G28_00090 [Neisseria sp.]|nr:hypothetical protein [Neisseria sp.]